MESPALHGLLRRLSPWWLISFGISRTGPCVENDFFSVHHLHLYNRVERVELATVVEGDPKAPFSIATTPRCRGGWYSVPMIASLYP